MYNLKQYKHIKNYFVPPTTPLRYNLWCLQLKCEDRLISTTHVNIFHSNYYIQYT